MLMIIQGKPTGNQSISTCDFDCFEIAGRQSMLLIIQGLSDW